LRGAHGPLQLTCSDPTRLPDLQIETADGKP
jgi:hypothetical protein